MRQIGAVLMIVACGAPPGPPKVGLAPASDSLRSSWYLFRTKYLPAHKAKRWILVLHRPTRSLADSLEALGVKVQRIYAPEHGLFGDKAAGVHLGDTTYRGVPVISLYGARKAPRPEELAEADAILFALRDVGVRHYTYLSTLAYVLRAAAQAQKPVWVLDFPNPHAHYTYGPMLDSALFSFVGLYPVPLVPGLTIGEYARLLVGEGWVPPVKLEVVPWEGWRRRSPLPTVAPFFTQPPSPALTSLAAIELYPILGWYEGTRGISVGRGTSQPFQQVGLEENPNFAPETLVLYGYTLLPTRFEADGRLYKGWCIRKNSTGKVCPDSLFRLGFFLLRRFRRAYPSEESFYLEFFDKLAGSPRVRWMERRDLLIDSLYAAFQVPPEWLARRQKYLLYPD
ncbi:MAG: DUF1343 domain-containing protein [Bacteroidia bacterium]|nr:DUF1343 domain-containing protein [Bacteroidia bacterium]MDW8089713.1 DUF1343 domain-containing protein [Bacteroidia bacterium]